VYSEVSAGLILMNEMIFVKVSRAAEECAGTLALSIQAEQCLRILMPIIQTADYPVNLAAIKMQTKVTVTFLALSLLLLFLLLFLLCSKQIFFRKSYINIFSVVIV